MINYHLAMFDVHCSIASRDITYLICYMTSQEHIMEGSYDIRVGAPHYISSPCQF